MTDAELAAARLIELLDAEREIERLRAQRILSNEDFARAFDLGLAAGEKRERAAVVALLREDARMHEMHLYQGIASVIFHLGDIIERGEHRREEER